MILNKFSYRSLAVSLLLTSLLLTTSCGKKSGIKGSEFIPKDILVQVISDLHIIDGITNDMIYYRKFNPGDSIDLYTSIFEKYDVSKEMYERTLKEYSKYPKLLDQVYDEVLMNLSLLQDKIEEERKEALKDNKGADKDKFDRN